MRVRALGTIIALVTSTLAQEVMRPNVQPAVLPGTTDCIDGICVDSTDPVPAPGVYEPIVVDPTPTASPSEVPELPSFSPSKSPAVPSRSPSESPAAPSASPTSSEEPVIPEPSASSSASPEVEVSVLPAVIPSASPTPESSTDSGVATTLPAVVTSASPTPESSTEGGVATTLPAVIVSVSPTPTTTPSQSCTPPGVTPTPSMPLSDYITCAQKDVESPLGCEVLQDDKECCRYSYSCDGLQKCTPSYCCEETIPTATPHPTPSCTPSYEPVDNYINCAVKYSEGGYKCHGDEEVDAHKECCRWSEQCGDLKKCTESYCCTEDPNHPRPSPSAHPGDYTMKCKEKDGLECSIGYEMDYDKKCCEYPGACGDLRACKTDYCCTDSGTLPPVDTEGACDCDGAVLNKQCYSSLEKAIKAASNGDTIYVGGDIEVHSPISFDQSLTFSGVLCDDTRAQIIATFDEVDGAIFEATNENSQEVNFAHLAITSEGGNSAAAFHSLGTVTDAPDQTITMKLTNVWIHDMYSQRPGVGIFIGSSSGLTVDDDCIFHSLKMSTSEQDMYAGGAAIAVVYLPEDSEINIAGYFKDNTAFYPDASLHSGGGAVYLDYMEGDVMFTAAFEKNSANQGGAVNVQGVLGSMVFDGYYSENSAIDDGYGARAGAVRVLDIKEGGSVLFNGSFIGNTAQGRGGAIATNMHKDGSAMYLDGIFQNNVASTVGGVWSLWSDTQLEGKVKLRGDSLFQGNLAVYDDSESGIYNIAAGDDNVDKLAEDEWFGRTIVVN